MVEELRDTDPTPLSPFYANYAALDGSVRRSAAQLKLLMERGLDWGYFPKTANSIFIVDKPEDKEVKKRGFEHAGLHLISVDVSR